MAQQRRVRQFILWGVGLVSVAALIFLAMRPQPVAVDIGEVWRGPMHVTVDEEGRTRVKEVYMVSAPITGHLLRIGLDSGDEVSGGRDPDCSDRSGGSGFSGHTHARAS